MQQLAKIMIVVPLALCLAGCGASLGAWHVGIGVLGAGAGFGAPRRRPITTSCKPKTCVCRPKRRVYKPEPLRRQSGSRKSRPAFIKSNTCRPWPHARRSAAIMCMPQTVLPAACARARNARRFASMCMRQPSAARTYASPHCAVWVTACNRQRPAHTEGQAAGEPALFFCPVCGISIWFQPHCALRQTNGRLVFGDKNILKTLILVSHDLKYPPDQ